ncbi:MAG: adaptor protein MecA [Lactobacillaceae bacterium]|jgi:adapter protein MecA 1/2|nr:adaptor protein MecA [Lactobacillaceae bacterium]
MEMERINDDTIRVVVSNTDLADRSISVIDLLGNQDEIEKFFYSILEEVDTEHDFENNEAVTFQVLPNRNGLELFISKNITDTEMMSDMMQSMLGSRDASQATNDEVSDSLLEQLLSHDGDEKKPARPRAHRNVEQPMVNDLVEDTHLRPVVSASDPVIFQFTDFEGVIQFANTLQEEFGASKLIEYKKEYFLELVFEPSFAQDVILDITSIAREYGTVTPVAAEVLAEHGRVIFDNNAVTQLLNYFK